MISPLKFERCSLKILMKLKMYSSTLTPTNKNEGGYLLRLAAGVIILKNDHILLVHEENHWSLPKGKREKNETMQQTAIREAKEETGLDVELISTAFVSEFVKDNNRHYRSEERRVGKAWNMTEIADKVR